MTDPILLAIMKEIKAIGEKLGEIKTPLNILENENNDNKLDYLQMVGIEIPGTPPDYSTVYTGDYNVDKDLLVDSIHRELNFFVKRHLNDGTKAIRDGLMGKLNHELNTWVEGQKILNEDKREVNWKDITEIRKAYFRDHKDLFKLLTNSSLTVGELVDSLIKVGTDKDKDLRDGSPKPEELGPTNYTNLIPDYSSSFEIELYRVLNADGLPNNLKVQSIIDLIARKFPVIEGEEKLLTVKGEPLELQLHRLLGTKDLSVNSLVAHIMAQWVEVSAPENKRPGSLAELKKRFETITEMVLESADPNVSFAEGVLLTIIDTLGDSEADGVEIQGFRTVSRADKANLQAKLKEVLGKKVVSSDTE